MIPDEDKTKEQLINELATLHQRLSELEVSEIRQGQAVAELEFINSINDAANQGRSLQEIIQFHLSIGGNQMNLGLLLIQGNLLLTEFCTLLSQFLQLGLFARQGELTIHHLGS